MTCKKVVAFLIGFGVVIFSHRQAYQLGKTEGMWQALRHSIESQSKTWQALSGR